MTTPNLKLTAIQLGDSVTPANNFLICVPDVADGTLTIKRGDDTVVATIDAVGKVVFPGNALPGQTLQDVKSSRALGTPYTNNTVQPIEVYIAAYSSVLANFTLQVEGKILGSVTVDSSHMATLYAKVPVGKSYVASITAGTPTLSSWGELR